MFSNSELAKLVKDTVPDDRSHAVVLDVNKDGLAVTVKMVKTKHWEVEGAFTRSWNGDTAGGAKVIYSW